MTRADKEAQLVAQYFNGTYNDAQFTCQCSGNNRPQVLVPKKPPVAVDLGNISPRSNDNTPLVPSTPFPKTPISENTDVTFQPLTNTPDPIVSVPVTMEDQLNEFLNNQNILPPLGPTVDNSVPSNMFIEEPQLPTASDILAQENEATGEMKVNLKSLPETDMKNAGSWLLALIAAGLVIRQIRKGNKSKKQ